jgi:hypothetical protein
MSVTRVCAELCPSRGRLELSLTEYFVVVGYRRVGAGSADRYECELQDGERDGTDGDSGSGGMQLGQSERANEYERINSQC